MERVVATYRVRGHEVSVVEVFDDDGPGYRLVVDGVAREEILEEVPDLEAVERRVLHRRLARPGSVARDEPRADGDPHGG
jgi:hypothetical protein